VAYNPLFAAEIFFQDKNSNGWVRAVNIDPEVLRTSASFREARERRVLKGKVVNQAGLNHQAHRRDRAPAVKQIVKDAVAAKKQLPGASGGKRVVRENRAALRA